MGSDACRLLLLVNSIYKMCARHRKLIRAQSPDSPPSLVADRVDLLGDGRGTLKLQVELEGLVVREGLPAMRALELAIQLDPNVLECAISRHRLLADLHRLRHCCFGADAKRQ